MRRTAVLHGWVTRSGGPRTRGALRCISSWSTSSAVGFGCAPRFLGIDDQGREVLEFIEGIAGADGSLGPVGATCGRWSCPTRDSPASLAWCADSTTPSARSHHLLDRRGPRVRGDHAPARSFVTTTSVRGTWCGGMVRRCASSTGTTRHRRIRSMTSRSALEWSIPFASDDECVTWRRFSEPPDRRHRVEVFAAAYGLTQIDGLVDAVTVRQQKFRTNIENLAARKGSSRPWTRWHPAT